MLKRFYCFRPVLDGFTNMNYINTLRVLLRILLGPLQIISGVVDWEDWFPEILGFVVWGTGVVFCFVCRLQPLTGMGIAVLGAVFLTAILYLCGYRSCDLD